MLWKRVNCV